jgi:hypothetical protein
VRQFRCRWRLGGTRPAPTQLLRSH